MAKLHTHHTHGATGYTGTRAPSRAKTGCGCGCGGPAPRQASALATAARMVVNAKIDAALERAAPLHVQAKGSGPLGPPRGVLGGKAHGAPDSATQRRVAAQGHGTTKAAKPAPAAPLRPPRGILSGRA